MQSYAEKELKRLFLDSEPEGKTQLSRRDLPLMGIQRGATMPRATERKEIVSEFFAVGTADGHLFGFLSRVADGFEAETQWKH